MVRGMTDSNPDQKGAPNADAPAETAAPASEQPSSVSGAEGAAESGALAQAKAEAASLKERLLRTAADFDNFRKRSKRDIDDAERRGKEGLLKDLLPVFDNLERAVVHASQSNDAKAIAEGVRMVLKQFLDTLERANIKRVESVGASFDPNVHEAIQQIETADQPPGTVVAEVQAGYQIDNKLVRAAMVVVAKAPSSN